MDGESLRERATAMAVRHVGRHRIVSVRAGEGGIEVVAMETPPPEVLEALRREAHPHPLVALRWPGRELWK